MLFVTLDFENDLRRDALFDSNAYVSAVAENELDRNKQHAPTNKFIFDDPPYYQIQETNGRLEKPIARITLKIDSGDITCSGYFVVMKKLTGPINGMHFMRHNSVLIHQTRRHSLSLFDETSQKR